MHAILKRRKIDDDGNPIRTESTNLLIDTRAYEIEFIDGTTETLTDNIIAYNLLVQVDYLLWLELYMVLKVQAQHLGHFLQSD